MSGATQRDARHVGRAGKREVCARRGELVSRPRRRGRTGSQLPCVCVHGRARARSASTVAIKHMRDKKLRREGGKNKKPPQMSERRKVQAAWVMRRQGWKCTIDSVGCVWMWGEEKKKKIEGRCVDVSAWIVRRSHNIFVCGKVLQPKFKKQKKHICGHMIKKKNGGWVQWLILDANHQVSTKYQCQRRHSPKQFKNIYK